MSDLLTTFCSKSYFFWTENNGDGQINTVVKSITRMIETFLPVFIIFLLSVFSHHPFEENEFLEITIHGQGNEYCDLFCVLNFSGYRIELMIRQAKQLVFDKKP